MYRDLSEPDVELLLQVRIRRISLFDINKHREEMDKIQSDLEEVRKHLKSVTKYAIAHLQGLLDKYGPLYPRLTKSSRYDEVDAREVAFKAFKVAYDRESGYPAERRLRSRGGARGGGEGSPERPPRGDRRTD